MMHRIFLQQIASHGKRPAIVANGTTHSFNQLMGKARVLSAKLRKITESDERPVLFMAGRNHNYAVAQWGIWDAGAMAVPLYPLHPAGELEYVAKDSKASVVVVDSDLHDKVQPIAAACGLDVVRLAEHDGDEPAPQLDQTSTSLDRRAIMLYTSGTTGRPKGVVHTHRNIMHHVTDLVKAWEWTKEDSILHFLPLHHAHGIINKFLCPMWVGASCEFLDAADAVAIWQRLADTQRSGSTKKFTIFMAVPTVYHRMIQALPQLDSETQAAGLEAVRTLRVTVCGSAACPPSVMQAWETVSGHRLLERYGMTELGMALSNPLHGTRHVGYVGQPLPSVEVRVVDPETEETVGAGQQGELRVRGPTVFKEYWGRPAATAKEFDAQGWFKTGDVAVWDADKQSYRILGRASVDIIKSGGYKVSALDVERELLEHADVSECAVLGVPDAEYGEVVAAVVALVQDARLQPPHDRSLQDWARTKLASYKLPRRIRVVSEIPKNAMGKVNKRELRDTFT